MLQLIEENSIIDPTYVEDFLLTHRTFIDNSFSVANQLLEWYVESVTHNFVLLKFDLVWFLNFWFVLSGSKKKVSEIE